MTDIEFRKKRFFNIYRQNPNKIMRISPLILFGHVGLHPMAGLKSAVSEYLEKSAVISGLSNQWEQSAGDILNMENITPNGMVVPKSYNQVEYNRVVYCLYKLIEHCGLAKNTQITKWSIVPNIRVKASKIEKDGMLSRDTEYPHSDCWSGVPTNYATFHLSLFGDVSSNCLSFFVPKETFRDKYLCPIKNYGLGQKYLEHYDKISFTTGMLDNTWYIFDASILHSTTILPLVSSYGYRVSIDMQIVIADSPDVIYGETDRDESTYTIEEFSEIGMSKIISFDHGIGEREPNPSKNSARNLSIIDT